MEMDRSTVTLMDEAGHSLTCYVEVSVPIDQEEYALLNPVDYPVDIFGWVVSQGEDEIIQPVEEKELAKIFPTAQAVLSEQNLKLKRSALSLTVEGDLPDIDEEEILILEMEDGDSITEQEEYQLLATFFEEEQEYSIYTPIDPVLFVVRLRENMQPELLSPEEFRTLQPKLQPLLEERLMDDLD
ncbi:DUF3727 domain-containing protein [Acaryochloris sp. IP29b_bin.148]|uniref:DUF3727 domain-containing protein n=1 Tax=Acaryochloris sp. IP29b_bin.148 TaxID=2969218 RepID=UPI0026099A56|nr:DUF3727 domain-containing protein [Acaryochloris sp. IP29b_bin.148]